MRRTRCRRRLAVCSVLVLAVITAATASAAPYVSCPGGYIADTLKDCPELAEHPVGGPGGRGGGGAGGGGLLGDLLDSIGLGGLGGLL